jgi:mannose-1-phosphate guanylyltransferase
LSVSRVAQRALVLSAGRGERLRPLTDSIPKPLLPVLGESIVGRTLEQLAAAGVSQAAVNLHHLGAAIRQELGPAIGGMPLTYSTEEVLLGTLGPFGKLREFFAGVDPVLLVNGDSLCDWPIDEVCRAHEESGADATLLLASRADPDSFGGGVVTSADGRVLSFRGDLGTAEAAGRTVFAGLHVISGRLLAEVEARPSDIVRQLYEPLLEEGGTIRAVHTDRRWHDLGLPSRYLAAVLEEAEAAVGESGCWRSATATVEPSASIARSVIESKATVEGGCEVSGSLLLNGSHLAPGATVIDSVVGPGVTIGRGSRVESQLVTDGDELVGTPIGTAGRR